VTARRAYDNSRRAAAADHTALQILDATIALFGSSRRDTAMTAIAAEAGVSVPTIYSYFPNREALFEALQQRINERLGRPSWPTSADELRRSIPALHRFFAEHESLVRAAVSTAALRPFWDATRRRRDEALRRALREATQHLSTRRRDEHVDHAGHPRCAARRSRSTQFVNYEEQS
jgi:AcrR family transcriptional regulator